MLFPSFAARSRQTEMMDDDALGFHVFADCLRDLETVNRVTLGYRPTLSWLGGRVRSATDGARFSLLDIGYGGGDLLRQIGRWSQRQGLAAELSGVDLNPASKRYASMQPSAVPIQFHTSDIFAFQPVKKFDFIVSSLFTHHLTDDQIVQLILWMNAHARHGWFINDLHRHPIAYYGFIALTKIWPFHIMVRHDGPISIQRAFQAQDWHRYLSRADVPPHEASVGWRFPFRLCVERRFSPDA